MTPEQAAALRKPFPRTAIGKLPKPYKADSPKGNCPECHGFHGLPAVHIDFVGHAITTDRLLSVDPGWTWEPVAFDAMGLPAIDPHGNLWIRLTIAGVTRYGVGDGKNRKEIIGDAIRNAAMRFGVALDLWTKEEGEQANGPVAITSAPPPPRMSAADFAPQNDAGAGAPVEVEAPASPAAGNSTPAPASPPNPRGRMFALLAERGINNPDEQRSGMTHILGRKITSRASLTPDEMHRISEYLVANLPPLPTLTGDLDE